MKIAILLKSGPATAEAERTLTMASDMLSQGHSVTLCLLQEAVRLCRAGMQFPKSTNLQDLMKRNLAVQTVKQDCSLRGIDPLSENNPIIAGDYSSLIDLVESSDRVIGIL
jgi:sulfur relay (sulfurtransferase) complex TusBCD TusD component (DsrE family)